MSGVKYRTISESEYSSLKSQALLAKTAQERVKALNVLNQRITEALKAAERINTNLASRIDNLNSKIATANKTASDLKQELHDTVTKTNKAIAAQGIKFERDLTKTRQDFADAMDQNNRRIEQVINDSNAALHSEIKALEDKTKQELDAVNDKVNALAKKVGDPATVVAMARDYLDVAFELLEDSKNFRYDLLLPGQLEQVTEQLKKAKEAVMLGADNPAAAAAALIRGQDAFELAKKFHDDLLMAENEWAAKLAVALEALAAAEAQIQANAKVEFAEQEFDVDFWSNGGLKKLRELTDKLRKQLEDPSLCRKLSCEDLESIGASAQLIADDSEHVLTGAFIALECSDDRAGLAADLAEDLAKAAGLEIIKGHGYEGQDQRATNMIHLKNGTTGFEVVIRLIPEMVDGKCGYRAVTEILDQGNTPSVAAAFDAALKAVMSDYDLDGNCPISVNPNRKKELEGWTVRKKVTVPAVSTPGADTIVVEK